ncbi:hypothetical protein Tco_0190622 [Tanacetum coccineum]
MDSRRVADCDWNIAFVDYVLYVRDHCALFGIKPGQEWIMERNIMNHQRRTIFIGTVSDVIAGGTVGACVHKVILKDIHSLINHYTDAPKDIWENVWKMILEVSISTNNDPLALVIGATSVQLVSPNTISQSPQPSKEPFLADNFNWTQEVLNRIS